MKIVVNADDLGLTDGVTQGIVDLLAAGAVSSTSAMVAVPGAADRITELPLHALGGCIGVHLQLTGGTPISPASQVPSLLSEGGCFPKRIADPSALNLAEVHAEWTAQIELASALIGRPPTHLDCHHGFNRDPRFAEMYVQLARKYGLAARGGTSYLAETAAALGVPMPSAAVRDWTGRGLDAAALQSRILEAEAESPASLVVVTHPGYDTPELADVSSLNSLRQNDLAVLLQIASENWYEARGFQMVSMSSL